MTMKIPRAVQRKIDADKRERELTEAMLHHKDARYGYMCGMVPLSRLVMSVRRFLLADARDWRSIAASSFASARRNSVGHSRELGEAALRTANLYERHAHQLEKHL